MIEKNRRLETKFKYPYKTRGDYRDRANVGMYIRISYFFFLLCVLSASALKFRSDSEGVSELLRFFLNHGRESWEKWKTVYAIARTVETINDTAKERSSSPYLELKIYV